MMLLDNHEHDVDTDPWPWGGEPIFRDGKYVGSVTTASYGYSLKKHVAIGFVHNYGDDGQRKLVTADYVKQGSYEIDIAGMRYPVTVKLSSPAIPKTVTSTFEITTKHDLK